MNPRHTAARAGAALCAVTALAACTPSFSPASPEPKETSVSTVPTPSATETPSATPTQALEPGRNPYESGATQDWSAELDAEPLAVAFDRQASVAVVVTENGSMQRLTGFQVTSSGNALPMWTYHLTPGTKPQGLDASNGHVYLNLVEEGEVTDFVILSARDGEETFRWRVENPLDGDVPVVVGGYDDGVGVIKLERRGGVAAILDSRGEAVAGKSRTFFPESDDDPELSRDLALVDRTSETNVFLTFPQLGEISGEECRSTADGAVCVSVREAGEAEPTADASADASGEHSASAEPSASESGTPDEDSATVAAEPPQAESTGGESATAETTEAEPTSDEPTDAESTGSESTEESHVVVEWSRDGFPLREHEGVSVPAGLLAQIGLDPDVTTRELGTALADLPAGLSGGRIILSDGDWHTGADWEASGEALRYGAPFVMDRDSLVNVKNGVAVNDEGTTVLVGEGNADNMFFQWDGETLTYLRPNG